MRKIDLFRVFMSKEAPDAVSEVLRSGYIGQGPKVEQFEAELQKLFNPFVLTVNSCTSALQLAVHMIKPQYNHQSHIITTPLTCFATASAILMNGVDIKWADVDPNNCNIDLLDVERKMNENTAGVMIVHWGGYPVDLDKLKEIQNKYLSLYNKPLPVIEDCAHCFRSYYKDKLIGTHGNPCCFSLQAIKSLTTGDGGLLITSDQETYHRAKLLRWFGLDRDKGASFRCIQDIGPEFGYKMQMNDIAASIGLANLPYMEETITKNQENAKFYYEQLKGVKLLERLPDRVSSDWLFTMRVEKREEFIKMMHSKGVDVNPVHARCDKHSCVKNYYGSLPGMDELEKDMICIPVGWWVDEEDRQYIVDCIKSGW